MLLADYRMPQMNGIEFLEAAMDLFPRARRVLLTAYADTDAAIDAINVVDLDHYLLKPWNPPEEKLYPVLDSLLDAWAATPDAAAVAGDPGGRPPVVGAVLQGPRLPGPQPRAVPLAARRRARRRSGCSAAAGRDRGRRAAGGHHRGQDAGAAERGRAGRAASGCPSRRPADFYDLVVVGAGPAGLGRGRLRRLGGAAHRAGRAAGHRRAGRAEQPDRELPRLPRRGLRRAAHRPGPPAGAAVRRRAAHHPRGGRARRDVGATRVLRFGDGSRDRRARRGARHRRLVPACWTRPAWTT